MAWPPTIIIFFLVISYNSAETEEEDESPLVHIEQGTLRGINSVSIREREFLAFLGIPYAKPPIGDLRFKAPEFPDPWNETLRADSEGSDCLQINLVTNNIQGDENCLYLNVFTNKLPENQNDLKAVMVWIHGGGFIFGSGSTLLQGPDHLLTEDIVLVTLNYRLGLLGFLSLIEAGVPGNNGMKDQVMALRWVQKNIAKFGGDPNRVTIFGESAGGASVHLHLLSPMTTGLFHRAISQSGTGLSSWAYSEPESLRALAFGVGDKIGCKFSDAVELLKCLRKQPALDFLGVEPDEEYKELRLSSHKPTREDGSVDGEEVFLPGRPSDLVSERKFHVVPYITGINNKETITFLSITSDRPLFWEKLNKHFDMIIAEVAGKDIARVKNISGKIKKYYFGNNPISSAMLDNFMNFFSDYAFLFGADTVVRKHAAFSTAPVYYYYFQFDGELGIIKRALQVNISGVAHADDLGYMFSTAFSPPVEENSDEMKTLTRVVKMWTNFAKTGTATQFRECDAAHNL